GNWLPLDGPNTLGWQDAAAVLGSLLQLADRAAASGRLLVLGPAQVYCDGPRAYLPLPNAPRWPLSEPLLAEPSLLAPEVRTGNGAGAPWPAAAYNVAATMQSVFGEALGFPP